MIKLLIVDDSPLMRRLLGGVFGGDPTFKLETARNGIEALEKLHAFGPDVITLDLQMPHMDGLACLKRIMRERPCPVVILSSLSESGGVATLDAMGAGAVDFIPKPSGAMSLAMDEFAPLLRERVISAATARVSASRLVERVRMRLKSVRNNASETTRAPARPISTEKPGLLPGEAIVLVGCSTGGPPALDALLAALPAEFPWPVVVAQHMPAAFTGPLARRLDRVCALTVREVVRTEALVAGTVLIGRGDADVILTKRTGTLVAACVPSSANYLWHPSVDRLVSSAMQHVEPSRLVGVLMTGMGDDGARTMAELVMAGGRTIAEHEETAVVWGMPGELVKRGGASRVLPVNSIAAELCEWVP